MRPIQFGTQCVPNWKRQIELTHFTKLTSVKSLAEIRRQALGKTLQQRITIPGTIFAALLFLDNAPSDFPVRLNHREIDRSVRPPAGRA